MRAVPLTCKEINLKIGRVLFSTSTYKRASLPTSFCVVAVSSVVAGAEALPMMHHYSGELIEEVLWAWWTCGAGAAGTGAGQAFGWGFFAAVWFHVEKLVEADVNSDFLPVVPSRPPGNQSQQSFNDLKIFDYLLRSQHAHGFVLWCHHTWSVWGGALEPEAVCGPSAVSVLQSGWHVWRRSDVLQLQAQGQRKVNRAETYNSLHSWPVAMQAAGTQIFYMKMLHWDVNFHHSWNDLLFKRFYMGMSFLAILSV